MQLFQVFDSYYKLTELSHAINSSESWNELSTVFIAKTSSRQLWQLFASCPHLWQFLQNSQIHHEHIHHRKNMEKIETFALRGRHISCTFFTLFTFLLQLNNWNRFYTWAQSKLSSSKISPVSSICPFFPLGMHHKNQFLSDPSPIIVYPCH